MLLALIFLFHVPEMSMVLAKDHKASSISPLLCIMKASISTALGRSFIYTVQRKTIFWKTSINHRQYSKSQCFYSKTQSNVFILAKEQVSGSQNNTVLHTKETQRGSPALWHETSFTSITAAQFWQQRLCLMNPEVIGTLSMISTRISQVPVNRQEKHFLYPA